MEQAADAGRRFGVRRAPREGAPRVMRGQAIVEFAIIATLAIMLLLIGIQLAVIGQADLAVGQLAYFGARYATVNYTQPTSSVVSAMISNASPTISKYLKSSNISVTCSNPADCTPPRQLGQNVTISITYDATNNLVLPKKFLGLTFPTSLSAQETMMCE